MTGFTAVLFVCVMLGVPLAAVILYAILIQKGFVRAPGHKEQALIVAGDAEGLWLHWVVRMFKLGFVYMILTLAMLSIEITSGMSATHGIINTSALFLPAIFIISGLLSIGVGIWQLTQGWERAINGRMGRGAQRIIDAHLNNPSQSPKDIPA